MEHERPIMVATFDHQPATVYEMWVHHAVEWLTAHSTKPAVTVYTAIVAWISAGSAGAIAWIAQTDLAGLGVADIIGTSFGIGIVFASVRFLRSVYREALDITRTNLDSERADRLEDRERFESELAKRDEHIGRLEQRLDEALASLEALNRRINNE